MKLPGSKLPPRHLQPGELFMTQEPQWVITLLGSCVSVTMFNVRFRLSVICHALFPKPHGKDVPRLRPSEHFRYVSHAIPAMAEQFARVGLQPGEVEVKMLGGGNVIDMGGDSRNDRSIGGADIALTRHILRSARFQIKGESVGGKRGCKIEFNTRGQVLHKHLSRGQTKE